VEEVQYYDVDIVVESVGSVVVVVVVDEGVVENYPYVTPHDEDDDVVDGY
jgi:hypothetical protein